MMIHRYWRIALLAPVLGFLLGAVVFGLVNLAGAGGASAAQRLGGVLERRVGT
ncbi:hypothetical protein [Cryobacterium glaciale]|uniref:hypothetical protein n=1 Tax=Cryobacterium glaciale TaxID=1259145 RepID=UPI00141A8FAF|nr:hypothetical protein [Cryobacterium glaciale]